MAEHETLRVVEPINLLITLANKLNCEMSATPSFYRNEIGSFFIGTFHPWSESPDYFLRTMKITDDGSLLQLRLGVSDTNKKLLDGDEWSTLCVIDVKRYGSCPATYRYTAHFFPSTRKGLNSHIDMMDENVCRLLAVILQKWIEVVEEFKLSELPRF